MDIVKNLYLHKESLIIIGLTGRTGSGCSTTANILQTPTMNKLPLHEPKSFDFKDTDERKYSIIYNYMSENQKWVPFDIIELSSIIIIAILENGLDALMSYLLDIQAPKDDTCFTIGDFSSLKKSVEGIAYMFDEMQKFKLSNYDGKDAASVQDYYAFYTKTINEYKKRIKKIFFKHSCYETKEPKLGGRQQTKMHLYTHLLQLFGNNLRATGNPYNSNFSKELNFTFLDCVNNVIKIISDNDKQNMKQTRICIDAIRNPFEAYYFKDLYKSFYLFSINTDDNYRVKRLKHLSKEELDSLDTIEYPTKMQSPYDIFFHQNIQGCIEIADVHIHNPDEKGNKRFLLTQQVLKFVALMIHPGLITPTHEERCMQLAYNAKYNSGCLSRQVGAVVTRSDFSVASVGWNDVPKGQISCNLRAIDNYCKNKDTESYSEYELYDDEFISSMGSLNTEILKIAADNNIGRPFAYCFKDVYNSMKSTSNQVYTRSLHAEENAFLQISKYGGNGVRGGYLFTTASPCELCAKKAYQLELKRIYYIDPYPGISQKHILTFGEEGNPEMRLFFGAIGNAYISLYSQRMAQKDELELISGIDVKQIISKSKSKHLERLKPDDIKYNLVNMEFEFVTRETIQSTRDVEFVVQCDKLEFMDRYITWTGSSYDGTKILEPESYRLLESNDGFSPYKHRIFFDAPKNKNDAVKYKTVTLTKDQEHIMQPYFSYTVMSFTDKLALKIVTPSGLIKGVKKVIYADVNMKIRFSEENLDPAKNTEGKDEYLFKVANPNLFYIYGFEWEF